MYRFINGAQNDIISNMVNRFLHHQVIEDIKNAFRQADALDVSELEVDNVQVNEEYSEYSLEDILNSGETYIEDAIYIDMTLHYEGNSIEIYQEYDLMDGELVPHWKIYDDTDMIYDMADQLME